MSTGAELEDMDQFNEKYEAFMSGDRPTELLQQMFNDYDSDMDEGGRYSTQVALQTAQKIMANEDYTRNIHRNELKWPERFKTKAALYTGPFKETYNQTEFMTCVPDLENCKTTHSHSVSVSELYVLKQYKPIQ